MRRYDDTLDGDVDRDEPNVVVVLEFGRNLVVGAHHHLAIGARAQRHGVEPRVCFRASFAVVLFYEVLCSESDTSAWRESFVANM